MAKKTPLAIERDAEEIFNILYSEENSSTLSNELEGVEELELVFLAPNDGKDSDKDDAPSDAEKGSANIKDIGRGVLSQSAEIRAITADEKNDIKIDPNVLEPINTSAKQSKKKSKRRHWVEKELSLSSQAYKIPNDLDKPDIARTIEDNDLSPVDMFKMCFDEDFMKLICSESQKYAAQKGESQYKVSVEELYKYFGILLFSGYVKMPFRRMYWETKPDANCFLVSKSMSRNRFEKIHQYLHFNDNMNIDPKDKVFKVRPILDHFNKKFGAFFMPLCNTYSLDEAMESYYGHHSMKQFIRRKPIRYGFKFGASQALKDIR